MVNVHASGGRAMLEAARQAAERAGLERLIAVTLLTSIDARALADLPMAGQPEGIARRLALLAKDCGLDGVVCSAADLAAHPRTRAGRSSSPSCPGIRPAGADVQDQKRVATPASAIAAGADLLVIGRPVTGARRTRMRPLVGHPRGGRRGRPSYIMRPA